MPRSDKHDETVTLSVPSSAAGERLDRFLGQSEDIGLSRTKIQKLIDDGLVTVDGVRAVTRQKLTGGESIAIVVPPPVPTDIAAEAIPLDVIYEDDHLVVVNKPAGMVTHPAAGNHQGTLVNALVHRFRELPTVAGTDRPGIVHRLDKDTSGLLVVARTSDAYANLQKMIQDRSLERTYLALVCGHMRAAEGKIELPIGRSLKNRKQMTVTGIGSKEAVTHYKQSKRYRSYDLLDVRLGTGRTHQIRVHFSHLGHPVFGDPDYGGREKWHRGMFGPERPLAKRLLGVLPRQALHARRLAFSHPMSGIRLELEAPLPPDFASVLAILDAEGT